MAIVTKLNATPHMLRLLVDHEGESSDLADITQAALVGLCVPGPLKAMLTAPLFQPAPGQGPTPNDWADLHTDARLTTRLGSWGVSEVISSSYIYRTVSTVNELTVAVGGQGACIVELQYENTLVR